MIKAELGYNPYLNETVVKFNNNLPRINSLVEKYMESKLQEWIRYVPNIFHDEMNGYDFDFLFSGTELEFNLLKKSFSNANVSESDVTLVHVDKLESRNEKLKRIKELLDWLRNNENSKFDFISFFEQNIELINNDFNYIVLHAEFQNVSDLKKRNIKVESIMNIVELEKTNLINTPILFYINEDVLSNLQAELNFLLKRNDIRKNQIFFYIDKNLNVNNIRRIIVDLGINEPQILESIDDEVVLNYLEIYPMTDHIVEMIKLLREAYYDTEKKIYSGKEKVAITNNSVHEKITELDGIIKDLRNTISRFETEEKDNFENEFEFLKNNICNNISQWRSKKTKMNSYSEAKKESEDFIQETYKWLNEFKKNLNDHEQKILSCVSEKRKEWYLSNGYDVEYKSEVRIEQSNVNLSINFTLVDVLLELKHEDWVTPDKSILAQIFGNNEVKEEPVFQTTWFMNEWKDKITEVIVPIIDSYIKDSIDRLNSYTKLLEDDYKNNLNKILNFKNADKENLVSQLSSEERQVETDFKWLKDFNDQLAKIERG